MISENELNPAQKYKMEQVLFGMKKNKRNFVKKYGMKAEALMRKRALKIAKQYTPEPTPDEMKDNRLKQLVQDVLSKPLDEKKKSFPDLKDRGIELDEDLDLGHEDNEPHMVKSELYKIAQNALELYKLLEPFDKSNQEVDIPSWLQAKITTANTMLNSAKSYLEFELKEPQIDNIVNMMPQEDNIDEGKLTKKEERIVKALKRSKKFEKDDPEMYAIAKSLAETILQRIKNKK